MPTASDIFKEMPNRFNAGAAGDMNATIQFDLSGDGGGQWHAIIANGTIAVNEGPADAPKATLIMDANDFVDMSTGQLNAMAAFMGGKIKVEGDLGTIMKLQPALGL
ncbi:MAG: SCP2 sterol-binding domain-containing protein [Anaerolinea sp.]|nr:SCP2 sterol-binding domain-containing protein [Anaerolinea sp.]